LTQPPPLNPYAAPRASFDVPATTGSTFEYRPLSARAVAVTMALGVFCLFSLLSMGMGVGAGSSGQSLTEAWEAEDAPFTRSDLLELGEEVSILLAVIAICFFLPQANRNGRALTGLSFRFTPASTIWWYFVPFLNLVRPYQAAKEIWQASTAAGPQDAWFTKPAPVWMRLWWGTWIAYNGLWRVVAALARRSHASADTWALLARITGVVAAACLIYTAIRITTLQAKRFTTGSPFGGPP
jgi:hypothetical protein